MKLNFIELVFFNISILQVDNLYAKGHFEEAKSASNSAKGLAIAAMIFGPIIIGAIILSRSM